eukprot:3284823-Alexandrium_andersonii.AAC.1
MTRARRGGAPSRRSGCRALARTRASSFGWPASPEVLAAVKDEEAGLERVEARGVLEGGRVEEYGLALPSLWAAPAADPPC